MKEVPVNKSEQEIYNLLKIFLVSSNWLEHQKYCIPINFYFKNLISSFTDKKLVCGN